MNSSNPVFSRRGFFRDVSRVPLDTGYRDPSASYVDQVRAPDLNETCPASSAMTIDDVVTRTAIAFGTVSLAAVLSWVILPVDGAEIGRSYGIAVGSAVAAFVLALTQLAKRKPSPVLILAYAALEGDFLGVVSSITSAFISPGIVIQAVLGTLAVFAGVLIAYKKRWIRVTRRFHGFTIAAAAGLALLMVADLLFSSFGAGNGLGFSSGSLGVLFGVFGIVLGACFLALDFRQVEDGIASGAPRDESWTAAFGLTTTLVWIYLEMLRVLTILRSE
ncbi:Bax inhibitor-1/YccA family protein [Streptomyces sp. NPDC057950]|uniref:Bax inhibitor-1/YccA family protein n=1 Tax=Streptomyces sp. NPDC057950 TaxID=3346288 RepID=UPI0036E03650